MKTVLAALAAVTAIAGAAPAMAAPYNNVSREIAQLDNRVDAAYARRAISRSEHARLESMVSQLRFQYRVAMRDGRLSRYERNDLDNRIDRVQRALRMERRDSDRRPR